MTSVSVQIYDVAKCEKDERTVSQESRRVAYLSSARNRANNRIKGRMFGGQGVEVTRCWGQPVMTYACRSIPLLPQRRDRGFEAASSNAAEEVYPQLGIFHTRSSGRSPRGKRTATGSRYTACKLPLLGKTSESIAVRLSVCLPVKIVVWHLRMSVSYALFCVLLVLFVFVVILNVRIEVSQHR